MRFAAKVVFVSERTIKDFIHSFGGGVAATQQMQQNQKMQMQGGGVEYKVKLSFQGSKARWTASCRLLAAERKFFGRQNHSGQESRAQGGHGSQESSGEEAQRVSRKRRRPSKERECCHKLLVLISVTSTPQCQQRHTI